MSMRPPIHIIGVPLDLGGNRRGVDMGPSALRIAGIGPRLAALGREVVDRGNVASPVPETRARGHQRKKFMPEIARVCRQVYRTARASHDDGALPVVLGGDHSVAVGSVAAAAAGQRARGQSLGLLWIDAHGDMNTPETTRSGNVHGMALAATIGPEPIELARIGDVTPGVYAPTIAPANTVLVGVRNLDDAERERVVASGVRVFTMKDIDRDGMAAVAREALGVACRGADGIHVSLDLDVCDPTIAPGVGTPVKGGLSYREAHLLMETVADSGALRSLDLVEVNPILDAGNATAELGVELALSALGLRIL